MRNDPHAADEKTLSAHSNAQNRIEIKSLKAFVLAKFPKHSALKNCLLSERDFLTSYEYVAKLETWLNLLRMGSE
jgi:hypothetical protein